ncbi:hypothetical protein [Acetoanaerobium noterae]|uniref:hypothetical protein n=1 Tax=Acetoanaerobium noterae TaxID=745369 RepID=UPI0033425F0E
MNIFSNNLSAWMFPLISLLILFFSNFVYSALLESEGNPEINLKLKHSQMMYIIFLRIFQFVIYTTLTFFIFERLNNEIKGTNILFIIFWFLFIIYDSVMSHYKNRNNNSFYFNSTSKFTKQILKIFLNIISAFLMIVLILILLLLTNKLYIIIEYIKNIFINNVFIILIIAFSLCIYAYSKKNSELKKYFFNIRKNQEKNEIICGIRIIFLELMFSLLIVAIAYNWNKPMDNFLVFVYYLTSISVLFIIIMSLLVEKKEESIYVIQIFDFEKKNIKEIRGSKIINKGELVIIYEYVNSKGIERKNTRPVIYNSAYIYKIDIL